MPLFIILYIYNEKQDHMNFCIIILIFAVKINSVYLA